MAYRLRYKFIVDYLPPGTGLSQPNAADSTLDWASGAQVKAFLNSQSGQVVAGAGTANAINAADITALTNGAAADMAAQLTANLGQLAGFVSGGA